jgi:hypothetical protein
VPVARKQQKVAQEDETDRRKHREGEPLKYPARPSEHDKQPSKQCPVKCAGQIRQDNGVGEFLAIQQTSKLS